MSEKNVKLMHNMPVGEGSDSFEYRESDVLASMTVDDLEAIWDLVPTEDRDFLTRRYRKIVKKHAIASDEQEIQLTDEYLQRYQYEGLVPAGEQWVRISSAKRLQMKAGDTDVADFEHDGHGGLPWMMMAVVGFGFFLFIFWLNMCFKELNSRLPFFKSLSIIIGQML
jgi:hypothetical protein